MDMCLAARPSAAAPGSARASSGPALRIGSVSFLNARPLIYGLDAADDLKVALDVPSALLGGMRDGRFDVALLPVIDYQRLPGLRLLTAGGIGCDGPTLTVRVFSPAPIDQINVLACDPDSHTSVALARVVLAERFGVRPELLDLRDARVGPETPSLLIGDKVVCEEPQGRPYQLDLGEEWKRLTGLPFVFAAWMARAGVDFGDLPARLERAKQEGLAHLPEIIAAHAVPRGWPPQVARQYLTHHLRFDVGPAQLQAIRLFHELAAAHGAFAGPVRPLELYSTSRN